MRRRDFLATGVACSAGAASSFISHLAATTLGPIHSGPFRLNYAPHFGMFRHLAGDEPLDQIRFLADQGFRFVEDVGLKTRSRSWQRQTMRELDRCGIEMGAFEATADFRHPTFTSGRHDLQTMVLREMESALDVAERMNARWVTVVPGRIDHRISRRQQTANVLDLMRRCADLCDKRSRVMLLEPIRQSGMFLRNQVQAMQICRVVGSPACKVLFDIGDRPASTKQILAEIDQCSGEIGYFRLGDFPGRKEPGTGEIDFYSIFQRMRANRFSGVLGMDHGNLLPGDDGELRVIEAYAALEAG